MRDGTARGEGGNWLKSAVLPVGLATIDLCWLYPWALLLGFWAAQDEAKPLLSAASVFALLFAARAAATTVLRRGWTLPVARLALVVLGVVAVLAALRADQFGRYAPLDLTWLADLAGAFPRALSGPSAPLAFAFGIGLWWRGLTHARGAVTFEDIAAAFGWGIVALVAFLLVLGAAGEAAYELLRLPAGLAVVGYFLAGLTSLALARLVGAQSGAALALNRHWLVVLLGVVGGLLLVTLGLAQLLSFGLLAAIAGPLLAILDAVASLLVYVIVVPVGLLLEVLFFVARLLLHPGTPPPSPNIPDLSLLQQMRQSGTPAGIPAEIVLAGKWLVVVALAAVAVTALVRAVTRRHNGAIGDEAQEERDSVWVWRSARATFWVWLLSRWRGLFRRSGTASPPMGDLAPAASASLGVVWSVREVYRHLLRAGASVGAVRLRAATPYEHLPLLQAGLGLNDDLAAITEAYVRARYGHAAPSPAEVEAVRRRWAQVLAARDGGARATRDGVDE